MTNKCLMFSDVISQILDKLLMMSLRYWLLIKMIHDHSDVVLRLMCNSWWYCMKPSLDLLVVDNNANHAKYDSDVEVAIFFLAEELDELDDAMIDQADVPALFLYDVVEHTLL